MPLEHDRNILQLRGRGKEMSEKEKIEQLEEYRQLIFQIKGYSKELKMYRSLAVDISQKYSDMPHGSGNASAKYEKPIDAVADLLRDAESDIHKAVQMRAKIKASVDRIPNHRYRTLLTLWYINCVPLDQIAEILEKSDKRSLYKLRKSALKQFNI